MQPRACQLRCLLHLATTVQFAAAAASSSQASPSQRRAPACDVGGCLPKVDGAEGGAPPERVELLREAERHPQVVQALGGAVGQVDQQGGQARPRLELLAQQAASCRGKGGDGLGYGGSEVWLQHSHGTVKAQSMRRLQQRAPTPEGRGAPRQPLAAGPARRAPCGAAAGPLDERLPAGAAPRSPSSSDITSAIWPS